MGRSSSPHLLAVFEATKLPRKIVPKGLERFSVFFTRGRAGRSLPPLAASQLHTSLRRTGRSSDFCDYGIFLGLRVLLALARRTQRPRLMVCRTFGAGLRYLESSW